MTCCRSADTQWLRPVSVTSGTHPATDSFVGFCCEISANTSAAEYSGAMEHWTLGKGLGGLEGNISRGRGRVVLWSSISILLVPSRRSIVILLGASGLLSQKPMEMRFFSMEIDS